MRIRRENGAEYCTNCGNDWVSSSKYERCCNVCLCPDTYANMIDDLAFYSLDLVQPLKPLVEDLLTSAVPPMTWEQLYQNQPRAKTMFQETND